jgi:endonuclease/exonuclease/phosphatase family metal-dependent hydrolase
VYVHLFEKLSELLTDFEGFFAPEQDGFDFEGRVDFDISWGQATFIRKSVRVLETETVFVYLERNGARALKDMPSNMLCTRISRGEKELRIINLHGVAHPGHGDTADRLAQSEKILTFLAKERGGIILCGDFNLRPENQSFAMLEAQLRNCNRDFRIELTRTRLAPFFGKEGFDPVVDYVLTSPDAMVTSLTTREVEVSDHLPLVLEFS